MRSTIKVKPEMLDHYIQATNKHVNDWLGKTTFNHMESQKETIIFTD